jgi:Cu2+-exporting ATPase
VQPQLLHSVGGRLRLRVPAIAADRPYARRVAALARGEADVADVRVNRAAASIAVRYEPTVPAERMRARIEALVARARDVSVALPQTAAPAAREGASAHLGPPAMTAGLAVLAGPLGVAVPAPLIAGAVALAAVPIARRALHSVRAERRLSIDVLDLTAIVLTTLRGSFLAPAVMISLVEVGEAIRERTARASERETLDLLGSMAQFTWVERGGERQNVPIEEVGRGDTVVLYPGDRVTVDGLI